MKQIIVTIEGISPLLVHSFTDAAQQDATKGSRTAIVGGDKGTPMEQAEGVLYKGNDGEPIIPSPNLFRCIIDAGKYFKSGKSKVTTQKSSMIPACLSILELLIPIEHREPWTVDARPVRIPSTGGRILRYRPCFNDWRLTFTLEIDTEMLAPKLAREILDAAGKRVGLGDFRPDCKGPFGKFVVVSWAEESDKSIQQAA